MNDDQLKEDVTKLMAVIIKDRFLREKLILTEEFNLVARHIAPEMDAVVAIFSMRDRQRALIEELT